MREVFIIPAKRIPIGGFLGNFSELSATKLGAIAIKSIIETTSISPVATDSVYMGNVLSSDLG